jgi:hypothetical protein
MVQHHAANRSLFRLAVSPMMKKYLLVGSQNPRGAVDEVDHHAAASDDVELRVTHGGESDLASK